MSGADEKGQLDRRSRDAQWDCPIVGGGTYLSGHGVNHDTLGLAAKVNAQLRFASARGRNAPFVFVDTNQFLEAFRLAGRYLVDADLVSVAAARRAQISHR